MTLISSILNTLLLALGVAAPPAEGGHSDDEFLQSLPNLPDESVVDEVEQNAAENGCIRKLQFDEDMSLETRASMTPDELLDAATWVSECEGPGLGDGDDDPTDGGVQALAFSLCGPWGCILIEHPFLDPLCCIDLELNSGQAYSFGNMTVTCLDP